LYSRKKSKSEIAKKEATTQALPWVEKYRPKTLGDLISHDDIINTCK
jgi:replication factor C subunit 3/5